MEAFGRDTRAWFAGAFPAPTEVQRRGWAEIAAGRHVLLVAPTGSGKTLAAFLSEIDRLARLPEDAPPGVRCVYVSPLKALASDIERNLRTPLAGLALEAEREGRRLRPLRVDVRTGDTPARERQRQARDPGEILVTTPESLYLILGSRQRETLRTVTTVIVDEIHALAPTKRGVHLALSLERLAELAAVEPQRIGLSATVRPLEEVARYLGGDRPVALVDASAPPALELEIRVPVPDMEHATPAAEGAAERGLWPVLYPDLLVAIRAHRSTIVFVNSRGLAERLVQRLNELAGEELVLAHHGSVSHTQRARIEAALEAGEVSGIVATSSLELGVDMRAVDQVLLVESPGSVARGLQRVGRAGHGVGETSRGVVFPKFKGDLLECAVVVQRMQRGEIEGLRLPTNCMDVLAQQVVALCCERERSPAEIGALVRRAHPYRELTPRALAAVLDMLSGRYPSTELADLRPRLRWDRSADRLDARPGAALTARLNAGTIPDRGAFPVHLGEGGPRIGELDEEMVYEARAGDTFLLGASTWRVESIGAHRVTVTPAPGEPGKPPFWKGEGPGRPLELGRAMGAFVREYARGPRTEVAAELAAALPLDELAARNLADYLVDQREHTGVLPTDQAITVERFRDELGDWRVCILSFFGASVHAPWAMALERRLAERNGIDASVMYCDDGIVLRLADADELPRIEDLFPAPEELEDLLTERLGDTSMFAALFRENAVRSLLVTRRRPDQRSPLWAQRRKARELLAVARRYPDFPIVLETYRQAMQDVFDLPGLATLLGEVRDRTLRVDEVETRRPSPFARSVVFAYVAAYLYDGDLPMAERKAQALTLDRELLRELLGQEELRDLLDLAVIEELEEELAGRAESRRARDRDELADALRRGGDLTLDEACERCAAAPPAVAEWLRRLATEGRATTVAVAGEERWIAADEAGAHRDALGCSPAAGLPAEFLAGGERSLETLVRRFARRRGPFRAATLAQRFGLLPAVVSSVLRQLELEGVLLHGELRPGGSEREWCDVEVLRQIKRRTLARLRGEVAPVDAATYARFLARWHGLPTTSSDRRGARLEEVIAQLEGHALSWKDLTGEVLPARVPGFRLEALDLLAATGRVVWIGRGALGPSDGRLALYRRERVATLVEATVDHDPPSELHAALLGQLERRGASFLTELERALVNEHGAERRDVQGCLWDLVWAGLVSNDTFQPLRGRGQVGGRWFRVCDLLGPGVSGTERLLARARSLLERYGVVSREVAQAEAVPGGWGPLYRVLRTMEEQGQVRRGYFVEGLSGAQFASPGAADRLRAERLDPRARRTPEVNTLAVVDPANPWGAILPWPGRAGGSGKTARLRGARLLLAEGVPLLYVPGRGSRLTTFVGGELLEAAFRHLHELPRGGRGWLTIEEIDGVTVERSPHLAALERAGFVRDYRGYTPGEHRVRE